MGHASVLILLLGFATSANAASTAIKCSSTQTTVNKNFPPEGTSTRQAEAVYVLNDTAKTLSRYNEKTGGLDLQCPECHWSYGPKAISYLELSNEKGVFTEKHFKIDRQTGEFQSSLSMLWLEPYRNTDVKWIGTCVKVAMPKVASTSTTKF